MASIDLSRFFPDEDFQYSYEGAQICLSDINVLPQPRKTFEKIEDLSIDIKHKGLLEPLIVALFNRKAAKRYIEVINHLWKTSFDIGDVRATRHGRRMLYHVLLAGERRIKACRLLWETDTKKKIDVRLCKDIPPFAALALQHSENTHMQVPPHEEAYAYSQLFNLVRQADPKYSLARFAREIHRSPSTIRKALRFCDLPLSIQKAVEGSIVPYGTAVEIARIQEHTEADDVQLDWWFRRAIAGKYNVSEFQKLVTNYLRHEESGQMSLLDIMEEGQAKLLERSHFRSTVGLHMIKAIWSWIWYCQRVLALFEEGKLGKEDSPFSERSPLRVLDKLIGIHGRILPHLVGLVPPEKQKEAQIILAQVRSMIDLLCDDKPSLD